MEEITQESEIIFADTKIFSLTLSDDIFYSSAFVISQLGTFGNEFYKVNYLV